MFHIFCRWNLCWPCHQCMPDSSMIPMHCLFVFFLAVNLVVLLIIHEASFQATLCVHANILSSLHGNTIETAFRLCNSHVRYDIPSFLCFHFTLFFSVSLVCLFCLALFPHLKQAKEKESEKEKGAKKNNKIGSRKENKQSNLVASHPFVKGQQAQACLYTGNHRRRPLPSLIFQLWSALPVT